MHSSLTSEAPFYDNAVNINARVQQIPLQCNPRKRVLPPFFETGIPDYEHIIYRQMKTEELNAPPQKVYQTEVTATDRGLLMDWLDRLHYKCQLTTATYYRCSGIVDRVMTLVKLKKSSLPVVGAAAMLVASKVEDHRAMSPEQAVIIGEGLFNKDDLIRAESEIMRLLDFKVTFPTILFFVSHYLRVFNDESLDVVLYTRYLTELCTTSTFFFGVRASAVACTAIIMMRIARGLEPWPAEMARYADFSINDLRTYVVKLHELLQDRDRRESAFIRRKYGSEPFHCVALYQAPNLPAEFL